MSREEGWHRAVLHFLDTNLKKESDRLISRYAKESFEYAARYQGAFEVTAGGELEESLRSIARKAEKYAQGEHAETTVILSLEILQCYALYVDYIVFVERFAEWGGLALSCLKELQSKTTSGKDQTKHGDMDQTKHDVIEIREREENAWELIRCIFYRLHGLDYMKTTKREGGALASKAGSLWKNLYGDDRDPCAASLRAMSACLDVFPGSLKHSENFLNTVVGRLVLCRGRCQALAAACYASLPKIQGHGDAWSSYMQNILMTVHKELGSVLQGIEHKNSCNEFEKLIDPQSTPLRIMNTSAMKSKILTKSPQIELFSMHFDALDGAMDTLSHMMSSSFPVPVPIPYTVLIELTRRILSIDVLTMNGIEKVGATAGEISRLGMRCSIIQIKLLWCVRKLIRRSGTGFLPYILSLAEILEGALSSIHLLISSAVRNESDGNLLIQLLKSTREVIAVGGSSVVQVFSHTILTLAKSVLLMTPAANTETEATGSTMVRHQYSFEMKATEVACQCGMLAVLEAILYGGSAVVPQKDRFAIEDLVLHTVQTLLDLEDFTSMQIRGSCNKIRQVQLYAYKALLASCLAPSPYRASNGPDAIYAFKKGLTSPSASISDFCRQALLALESHMHPRSLELSFRNQDSTSATYRNEYGMPKFWSFLEFDGEKQYVKMQHVDTEKTRYIEKQTHAHDQAMLQEKSDTRGEHVGHGDKRRRVEQENEKNAVHAGADTAPQRFLPKATHIPQPAHDITDVHQPQDLIEDIPEKPLPSFTVGNLEPSDDDSEGLSLPSIDSGNSSDDE